MVAVLSVLASLHVKWDVLRKNPSERQVERGVAFQLRWDLEHAQTLEWSPREIRLNGFAGRSFGNGTVTHRPVEIIYAIRSGGARRWLVRQERQTDIRSQRGVDVQLVCDGVSGFEIGTLFENAPVAIETQPVPDRLHIVLHRGTNAKPMRFHFVLR